MDDKQKWREPLHKRLVRSQRYIRALEDGPDLTVAQAFLSTRMYNQLIDYARRTENKDNNGPMYAAITRKRDNMRCYRDQIRDAVEQYWAGDIEQKDLEKFQYAIHGPNLKKKWLFEWPELTEFVATQLATPAPQKNKGIAEAEGRESQKGPRFSSKVGGQPAGGADESKVDEEEEEENKDAK